MAYVLNLTYGTTTLDLNTSALRFLHYVPVSAPIGEDYTTETIRLEFGGTSELANSANIQAVNTALRRAYDYSQSWVGDQVYLNYAPEGYGGTAWRSEVTARPGEKEAGRLIFDDNAQTYTPWSVEHKIQADLSFTRRNYWEGTADVQVPLTNPNGTANTAGLNVYNCNDGGGSGTLLHYNYFDVAGTSIQGDLPGATRFEILNSGSTNIFEYFLSNSFNTVGTAVVAWYEGEAGRNTDIDTIVADATRSSGNVGAINMLANGTPSYYPRYFIESSIPGFAGNYCHLWGRARLMTGGGTCTVKMTPYVLSVDAWAAIVGTPNGITTVFAPPGTAFYYLIDLGLMRIPPAFVPSVTYDNTYFGICLQYSGTAAGTIYFDSVQIEPVDYRLRTSFQPGDNLTALVNQSMVIDGINNRYYLRTSFNYPYTSFGVSGDIYLCPGKDQRIYHDWAISSTMIDSTNLATSRVTAKLYYRPRRLTL